MTKWENGKNVFDALSKSIEKPCHSIMHLTVNNLRDAGIYARSQIILVGKDRQIARAISRELNNIFTQSKEK